MKRALLPAFILSFLFHSFFAVAQTSYCSKQTLSQGGLLLAQAPKNAVIFYLGKPVEITAEGLFVIGFGRDAESGQSYTIRYRDGKEVSCPLFIDPQSYDIQHIKGVAQKYVSPPEATLERIRNDNQQVREARDKMTGEALFLQGMIMPMKGPVTGVYGSQRFFNGEPRRPHFGLDIAGPVGTPVVAPGAGTITVAEPDMYFSGGTLVIDHGFGISSSMLHLHKFHVKVGDKVKQGQMIAEAGATGRVTGPHLDWRINWFQVRLDPKAVMKVLSSPIPATAKQ